MGYVEQFSTGITVLIAVIGILATLVSIITEVLKTVPGLSKLPTKLVVFMVSLIITPICLLAFMAWMKQPIVWYMVFASFMASFIIALVSMSGWKEIAEIAQRCIKKKDK